MDKYIVIAWGIYFGSPFSFHKMSPGASPGAAVPWQCGRTDLFDWHIAQAALMS